MGWGPSNEDVELLGDCKFHDSIVGGSAMDWPFGPYETVMGAILLLTIPIHRILTRDEPEMRVALSDIIKEVKEKGRGGKVGEAKEGEVNLRTGRQG